jgi:hypothetical protein
MTNRVMVVYSLSIPKKNYGIYIWTVGVVFIWWIDFIDMKFIADKCNSCTSTLYCTH